MQHLMAALEHIIELFGKPEFKLIELHQASTHLSIGILLGAVMFDLAAALFSKKRAVWREAAFWMQMLGTAFLLGTFALGFWGNPFAGKAHEMGQRTDWHKNFAYATLGAFALLAVWRLKRGHCWGRLESGFYAMMTLLGLGLIAVTGWMGGHIME
jgi:uncharacterized membrane protein